MKIGFDAKRAFHNNTGLGQYSRTLIRSLAEFYPQNSYFLFNPKPSKNHHFNEGNITEVQPSGFINRRFSSAWRSNFVKSDLRKLNIDIYHGLSHEIPHGIRQSGVKSVVTIHDLIFEKYPEQFKPVDVKIYRHKFRYACNNADHIIAISEQTKKDIIAIYNIPAEKITVCYQSCNPIFEKTIDDVTKKSIREKYRLPSKFLLSVGSIIKRKNLLTICKALLLLPPDLVLPLVVIGDGKAYKKVVKSFISANKLDDKIIFLNEKDYAKNDTGFRSGEDFPALFQSATALIYPSIFEGFGIPVLEALQSGLPVITSNTSSLPEAGGNAACYVNPLQASEIANGINSICTQPHLVEEMIAKGKIHTRKFATPTTAAAVMNVYENLL